MNPSISIIVDTETLDTTPSSIITEIALIAFHRETLIITDHLIIRPDFFEQLTLGRTWTADTIAFHRKRGTLPETTGLSCFQTVAQTEAFFQKHPAHRVWIQGTCFDRPIIKSPPSHFDPPLPWHFTRSSDARTTYDLAMRGKKHPRRTHQALEDCKDTLSDLIEALNAINRLDEI